MSRLSSEPSGMQLNSLQHETRGGDSRYVHVTANRQLWNRKNGFTLAAVALERVLWNHHLSFLQFEAQNEPDTLLFLVNASAASHELDDRNVRAINEDMEQVVARKPLVRLKEHSDLPGLFYAHRSERTLDLARLAVADLRSIENAQICPPSVGDSLYERGTLMSAVARPGFDLVQAQTDVARILTA
jgi:hypothetical protein